MTVPYLLLYLRFWLRELGRSWDAWNLSLRASFSLSAGFSKTFVDRCSPLSGRAIDPSSVACPVLECCRVSDKHSPSRPKRTVVGLTAGWVDLDVDRGGMRVPWRSSPTTWWSKSRTNDLVVILLWIRSRHVFEEAEPLLSNKRRHWTATGDSDDCYMLWAYIGVV